MGPAGIVACNLRIVIHGASDAPNRTSDKTPPEGARVILISSYCFQDEVARLEKESDSQAWACDSSRVRWMLQVAVLLRSRFCRHVPTREARKATAAIVDQCHYHCTPKDNNWQNYDVYYRLRQHSQFVVLGPYKSFWFHCCPACTASRVSNTNDTHWLLVQGSSLRMTKHTMRRLWLLGVFRSCRFWELFSVLQMF